MSDRLEIIDIIDTLIHSITRRHIPDYPEADKAVKALQSYIDTKIIEELEKPNQLLRSMWQIAERDGYKTNWEDFRKQLKTELEREHKIMYPQALNHRKDD
jgi:hypothetical protein